MLLTTVLCNFTETELSLASSHEMFPALTILQNVTRVVLGFPATQTQSLKGSELCNFV